MNDGFIKLIILNETTVKALQIVEHTGLNFINKLLVKFSYDFVHETIFEPIIHWIDV